ncbi:MAG TPA: coniferyl aldehyde dehydrogenase [Steroidobacteraceae bacterium]|nr:coniferyl aldehyde dehydrogenase [Steroidobacteraceae bacterium]
MATAQEPARLATHPSQLAQALDVQRRAFAVDPNPQPAERRERLARLARMLRKNAAPIRDAIAADFGMRSAEETELLEQFTSLEGIAHARRNLNAWMRPERRAVAWWSLPGSARLMRQPLGVVGIIVPWNYPLYLAVSPLTAALAAGNRAMLKMSEHTPRFGALFESLVARSFRDDEVVVFNGDTGVGKAFAALPFDHLLFTGSTAVGREVMRAASANLTPVTLELGGKSPAIVTGSFDVEESARRIMHAKLINAGQTCVAPDYALVPGSLVNPFIHACRAATQAYYPVLGTNPQYTSIASDRQLRRLLAFVDDARERGASIHNLHDEPTDPERRRMAPVALTDVGDGMRVMQEEIFGPVLPVVGYDGIDEAIDYVNARPRPLALYYFGARDGDLDAVLRRTVSGGVTVNNAGFHVLQEDLPFGGVGPSGMGEYHGRAGFDRFSKLKSVFIDKRLSASALLRPPYGGRFRALLRLLKR